MPIKLTYQQVNSAGLNQAISYLANQNGFRDTQVVYNVARVVRQFDAALTKARAEYMQWADAYWVKDEAGKPKLAEAQNGVSPFEMIDGKKDAFDQQLATFLTTEVELESYPLKLEDISSVKLSPLQMIALEPILDSAVSAEPDALQPQTT